MNESGDQQQQRVGSSVNPKIASDSGYGSNKSTQRSSGSSKSHESSVSSESSTAYPPHPNAPIAECQSHTSASPIQGGPTKRQGKKKKNDRKLSVGEKAEASKDASKSGSMPQSMDQSGNSGGNTSSIQNGSQQQLSQSQMPPTSKASSTHDSKALQMAALTHALSCMKKFHKPLTDSEINEEADEGDAAPGKKWQEYFANDIQVEENGDEDTFASVVSLEDGIIVYITPSIASILGFPKDMLVGRSFIDFVHPKDRMAFASHITCGMSFPMSEQHNPQNQGSNNASGAARVKSEPFYCRLRQYRGLKTVGFGVVDKTILYYPFKLTMTLKKVENGNSGAAMPTGAAKTNNEASRQVSGKEVDMNEPDNNSGGGMGMNAKKSNYTFPSTQNTAVHLAIVAKRIKSAYTFPEEVPLSPGKFVTRHSASCHFGHMDSEAISYLGHLPQDLIGNSVLDYYHPEDMGMMKDIYEGVMKEQGKPFRSKPYRFRVYNGTFAMLETDWSCFINPWSWKLEFVIGQHRVLKGPGNPNVFMHPNEETDCTKNVPGEILDESKDMQSEIKKLLTETVTRRLSADPLRQQSSRRRKDLAALMESLLEGMAKTENSDKSGSQCSGMFSVMERDSVMLGEISPHHDDQSGSNQSSETPPSYNQLNYRENIERFFQSHPKTVRSDESAESSKMETNQSANRSSDSDGSKSSPNIDYSSGSNVRLSNSSGSGSGSNENESGGDRDMCASPLTEERLSRHNEAMEKYMIQRHRELRGKSSMTPGSHKESRNKHSEKVYTPFPVASSTSLSNDNDKCSYYIKLLRCQRRNKCKQKITGEASHGLKRMGNASWDGDMHTAKQPHLDCLPGRNPTLASAATPGICCPGHNSINLWPPFSITMTPGITTSTYRSAGPAAANISSNFPGLPPCYSTTRPGGQPQPGSTNLIPETISMSATTPSAPLLFVPSQHHHHPHPQPQFVPQPVQLFPAGVVYQPLGSCIYGQPSPIVMPAGFLGTMIHPDQSVINPMESPSGHNAVASQGEAKGTATLPKVSEKNKSRSSSKGWKGLSPLVSNNSPINIAVGPPIPGTSKSSGNNKSRTLFAEGKHGKPMSPRIPGPSAGVPLSSRQQQHSQKVNPLGNEGSGSDESMNSSLNTKNSRDNDKEGSPLNSDADQDVPIWSVRRRETEISRGVNTTTTTTASSRPRPIRNKPAPWLEKVKVTTDLMYRYRVPAGDLSDVLRKDLEALKIFGKFQQSAMVNDQLGMLYNELNFEGNTGIALNLEEGSTSNSSSEENSKDGQQRKSKKPVQSHQYSKMVILYEENAPFPPETELTVKKSEAEV
ncbi:unnamed protein product [Orchesella dallaii]|uniref:Period circadian protein n=1 Tax=Orchesella dallaii TaxID=48710 RepID=A0ABP1Q973_9HEXA